MHGDERSPSDMDCYVTLTGGMHGKPKCYQTGGFSVCPRARNGSQKHGAGDRL